MTEPTFTPAADVIEVYKDGSGEAVVARAGEPMTYDRARALGIMRDDGIPRVNGVSVGGMQVVAVPGGEPPKVAAATETDIYHYDGATWEYHPRLPGETDEAAFARLAGPIVDAQGSTVSSTRPKRPRKAKAQ